MGNGTSQEKTEKWKKLDIAGKLALSVVIALVGGGFTLFQYCNTEKRIEAQKSIENDKLTVDRATNLLKHVASKDKRESDLAVKLASRLCFKENIVCMLTTVIEDETSNQGKQSEEISKEQVDSIKNSTDALAEIAEKSKVPEVQDSAKKSLQNLANDQTARVAIIAQQSLARIDKKAVQDLPARVYIHVQKGKSLKEAEKLKELLESERIAVPRINQVSKVPDKTEFRYFVGSDAEDIEKIKGILVKSRIPAKPNDLSNLYPDAIVRPRHYEIWFGSD